MNIEIMTRSQVTYIVEHEIRRAEARLMKVIDRLRKRILELELKKELKNQKITSPNKNKGIYKL